jgi:hypothetical protein
MYLNYKKEDASYAETCLSKAKSLFKLAKTNMKSNGRSRPKGDKYYASSSHYDDMVWGAIWLYTATDDESYLESTDEWMDIRNDYDDDPYNKKWAPAWDDQTVFNMLKMAQITGNDKYVQGLKNNFNWFLKLRTSPGGLPVVDKWGVLRYASAEAGAGFLAYKILGEESLLKLGEKIINYCLGSNPQNMSFLTNWGKGKSACHPHHRANEPNRDGKTNGILGALVGGPTNDNFRDDVNDYVMNEVAIDYNASFILGISSFIWKKNGGEPANQAPSVQITSPLNGVVLPIGATIKVNVEAKDKEGKVTKIELFKGDEKIKSSTSSPLTYEFKSSSAGEFVLRATATDDEGKVGKAPQVRAEFTAPCTPGEMMSTKGWRATSSHTSHNAGEEPASALDGNKSTRWASGHGQSKGMWFQLDMGYPRTVNRMILDATGSGTDYPKAYEVYASNSNTRSFDGPIAKGAGDQITEIKFDQTVEAQLLKVVCTEPTGGSWWSIHEVQVPCVKSTELGDFSLKNTVNNNTIGINAITKNNSVIVKYNLPEAGGVTIETYSLSGVRLGVLVNGIKSAGSHKIISNLQRHSTNVVIYRMKFGNSTYEKRVVILN